MATYSSVLAWRIPGTGEPGRLLSMGSHRVGHDKQPSSSSSLQIKDEKESKEGDGRDRLIQLIDLEVIHTTFLHLLQV